MIGAITGPVPLSEAMSLETTLLTQRPANPESHEPVSFSSRIRSASCRMRGTSRSLQPLAATASSPDVRRGKPIRPAPVTGSASCSAMVVSACPTGDQDSAGRSAGGPANCRSSPSISATGVCPRYASRSSRSTALLPSPARPRTPRRAVPSGVRTGSSGAGTGAGRRAVTQDRADRCRTTLRVRAALCAPHLPLARSGPALCCCEVYQHQCKRGS